MSQVKITQIKSKIGSTANQRNSLRTLGLLRINKTVIKEVTPQVQGLINTVRHLVKVEEV